MKKIVLMIVALGALIMTSCRKDYTCQCSGGTIGAAASASISNAKKNEAEKFCENLQSNYAIFGLTCELK